MAHTPHEYPTDLPWLNAILGGDTTPSDVVVVAAILDEPTVPDPRPDESWTKTEIGDWLAEHGVTVDGTPTKAELLDLVPD